MLWPGDSGPNSSLESGRHRDSNSPLKRRRSLQTVSSNAHHTRTILAIFLQYFPQRRIKYEHFHPTIPAGQSPPTWDGQRGLAAWTPAWAGKGSTPDGASMCCSACQSLLGTIADDIYILPDVIEKIQIGKGLPVT